MKLHSKHFEAIKSGHKTIEVRLFDEKRQQLKVGDIIEFIKEPDKTEKISTEIIDLIHCSSFNELVDNNEVGLFGYENKDDLLCDIYHFYTKDDERKFGVLGIKIRLIKRCTIKYLKAQANDLEKIKQLLTSNSGDGHDLKVDDFIIAKDDDSVVGCIRIKDVNGHHELSSLVVKYDYRRQGIGQRLVEEVLKFYHKRPIYLLCSKENEHFYALNHFIAVKPELLPKPLKDEYDRILSLPFAKDIEVVAMILN